MIKRVSRFIFTIIKLVYYKYLDSDFYLNHFHRARVEKMADKVRQKPLICVVFVLHDISKWKTEQLYLAMKANTRFEPVIVTTILAWEKYSVQCTSYIKLIGALSDKQYEYTEASKVNTIFEVLHPDIIFLQEPYAGMCPYNDSYSSNRSALFCYASYGFHNLLLPSLVNQHFLNRVWQNYIENESVSNEIASMMTNHGINSVVTGLPITDKFIAATQGTEDPWQGNRDKKRIIWAPHHTIKGADNMFEQSNFLEIADSMLGLAEKYKDKVQWAFKPHPVLYAKLVKIWGVVKTNAYYDKWREMECSQLEEGEYVGLFMHSDAMVHDCSSFIVEYQYTHKPVFFIQNSKDVCKDYSAYSRKSYDLHYKGSTIEDIEKFIEEVVLQGNDPLYPAREQFYNEYLLPPNGKTACENIINAILGE